MNPQIKYTNLNFCFRDSSVILKLHCGRFGSYEINESCRNDRQFRYGELYGCCISCLCILSVAFLIVRIVSKMSLQRSTHSDCLRMQYLNWTCDFLVCFVWNSAKRSRYIYYSQSNKDLDTVIDFLGSSFTSVKDFLDNTNRHFELEKSMIKTIH